MNNEMTVKELCNELWKLERDFELLDAEIQGVRFWEVIRFRVFTELSKLVSGYGQAHTTKSRISDYFLAVFRFLSNSVLKNPLHKDYNVEFLVYDHTRKINVEGSNIDIYTIDFIKYQDKKKFDVIEAPYLLKHVTKNEKNRKYRDHEMLTVSVKNKLSLLKLELKEKCFIDQLQSEIIKRFGVGDFNLQTLVLNYIKKFLYKFAYHKKLFQKRKPHSIYVVVSYENIPVIAAAKDLGVEVIEFQHGVISNYHFAYNFSDSTKKLKYFPDKLLTFGEYWAKTDGFPKQTEIEVYGFPFLNQQLEKYKGTPKKNKQVLFISQGTIGKKLSKRARELAESMPDYYFIYKLHPGEYGRWRNEYTDLVVASNLENLEVIDNNEKNLYSFFAESEYQVGVYSTAIFEGLTLNCKTILYNLPGIEYMKDLIDQGIVKVVHDMEEAISCIKNYKIKEFPKNYFFKEECSSKL